MPPIEAARGKTQRGAVLAEFAIVALLVWVLLAGTLELGRAFAAQHVLQNAARATARALSLEAVGAEDEFEDALPSLFDEGFLVFDEELLSRCGVPAFDAPGHGQAFEDLIAERPLLNRLLRPLMIFETTAAGTRLRYPGAVLLRDAPAGGFATCEAGSRYTVAVPQVVAGQVEWFPVVAEAPVAANPTTGSEGRFPLSEGGWSSLQIYYPFQSGALVSWVETASINPRTGLPYQRPEDVIPPNVTAPPDGTIDPSQDGLPDTPGLVNPYSGSLGLGRVYMLGREVRPYRRVLSASAAFRREVFL